jgi:hypothetical protein
LSVATSFCSVGLLQNSVAGPEFEIDGDLSKLCDRKSLSQHSTRLGSGTLSLLLQRELPNDKVDWIIGLYATLP